MISSLDEVRHADRRKLFQKSIIPAGTPQKHAGTALLLQFNSLGHEDSPGADNIKN
jgi:hypothetical protein